MILNLRPQEASSTTAFYPAWEGIIFVCDIIAILCQLQPNKFIKLN
jgi:hypothetical protein